MSKYNGIFQFKNKFSVEKIVKIMSDASRESKLYKLFDYYDEFVGVSIKGLINKNKQHSSNFRRAYNEDKSNLLLICGHVFNLEKLKKKLFLVNGLASNENRDEKIILKGYKEFGNRFAEYIDGAFIIIIYDFNERKITFIRDIVGQKKLYYYVDDNILLFSSNLKPLLSTDLFEKKICNRAFNQYLQLTYIPAPLSIIENVYELNAGEILEVHINGEIHKEKYWDLIYEDSKLSLSYDYCKEYLRNNVFKTVDNMIKNKSSIGAFLSGGIDSTIMVGVMSKLSVDPINTFTIGYSKNKDYDESNLAQIVANKFGTNHHIYFLDYNEVSLEINYILNEMDEPFADSSLIPSFMISKYAKKHVDYVITGDGGDELFAGYSKYLMDYYNDKYIKIPRFLRNCFEKTLYWLPDKNSFTRKARKVVESSEKPKITQHKDLMSLGFKDSELRLLLKNKYDGKSLDFIDEYYNKYKFENDSITTSLYTDIKVVVEGDMMTKMNETSNLSGLETISPLLAKEIIELSAKIPSNYKINNKSQKIILKETFKDIIPKEIFKAPKSGFGVPIGQWLQKELKNEMLELLSEIIIKEQGIFNYDHIKNIIKEHLSNEKNRSGELWTLFVFQKWYLKHLND